MGALSCLWCKNTAEASAKDGVGGLSSLLPQVQTGRIINAQNFQIEIIDQPDAKTQC